LRYLAERAQLFNRAREFSCARLHLLEQAHVLDRDHSLIGEGGDEFDLLLGKWVHRASHQHDHANRLAFPQQRNAEHCTVASDFRWLYKLVFRIGENVGYLNDPAFKRGSAGEASSSQLDWVVPHILDKGGRVTVASDLPEGLVLLTCYASQVRLAQPCGRLHERIQHRLQIEARAADYLERVSGGSLLPERFPELVEQTRVFNRDDCLIGKGVEKGDLSLREEQRLVAAECDRANRNAFSHQRDTK
jgi:hypothetical protein